MSHGYGSCARRGQVVDNGVGIPPSEFVNVLKKHATSKISCFEDLTQVRLNDLRIMSSNARAY